MDLRELIAVLDNAIAGAPRCDECSSTHWVVQEMQRAREIAAALSSGASEGPQVKCQCDFPGDNPQCPLANVHEMHQHDIQSPAWDVAKAEPKETR